MKGWGGVNEFFGCRSFLRRALDPKSSGNGRIGIDLTSKKDFMEKYLFFFENESIKVENSWLFSDFAQILLVLVVNYNEKQWEKSPKWTKSQKIREFSTLIDSFSKKNKYFFMKYFLEVRSIPILPFPLLFMPIGSSEIKNARWRIRRSPPEPGSQITVFILLMPFQNNIKLVSIFKIAQSWYQYSK